MPKDKVEIEDGMISFHCPACNAIHGVHIEKPPHPELHQWDWNGDKKFPTLNPSLNRESRLASRNGNGKVLKRCHFFIRDGIIDYCSDSTHKLAGKKYRLKNVEDW